MDSNEKSIDLKNNLSLNQSLNNRIHYLKQLKLALKRHADLAIYRLLDPVKYYQVLGKRPTKRIIIKHNRLIGDLSSQLSHYLSTGLIEYLGKEYPSFYYEEYRLGQFNIYFGNWWDHRLFGKLDVINLQFIFKPDEFHKLKAAFSLRTANERVNSTKIQNLVKTSHQLKKLAISQSRRDSRAYQLKDALKINDSKSKLPWMNGKIKAEHQRILRQLDQITAKDSRSAHAKNRIRENEHRILNLSKEDTILGYEKQSIQQTFGGFKAFNQRSQQLYRDYILNLAKKAQVQNHNAK